MRILHIISNMKPSSGGPQEAVRMMLRSAPAGSASEVVTLDDPTADFLRNEPFTIHALGKWYRLTPWLRANYSRFDGVVLHGMWETLSLSVLQAIAGQTPYVVYAHGMLDPYFKRAFPMKHLKKWLYWLPVQYWVMRRARRVVFTTDAERDLAAQSFWLHRWSAAVIALGADAPPANLERCKEAFYHLCPALVGPTTDLSFRPAHRSSIAMRSGETPVFAVARAEGASSPQTPTVSDRPHYLLFLGRIDRKKGCDLLLKSFIGLSKNDPSLHLVMAGPNSTGLRTELEALATRASINHRIHWPGMLQGHTKWGALAAADVFILPSHQENFGIAIVEALACGTPVLLTHPINIAADLAADGSALVEDDTLAGVTRLLTRWLALTPAERAVMRECATASVAARYDMRKNTQALFDLFTPSHTEHSA
jgi:glycosyltransferase involved in cell wall biosynthesis